MDEPGLQICVHVPLNYFMKGFIRLQLDASVVAGIMQHCEAASVLMT
jgi:hypothetical protein